MPGHPAEPPPAAGHSEGVPTSDGSGQELRSMEPSLDLLEFPFLPSSSPLQLIGEETRQVDISWSQDRDLQGCGGLERRWVLWHEFMKEHAHLDAWLRLAEQAVCCPNPAHITYVTAKEVMRKFERLRCDTGSQLIQLDSLTLRNRTLTQLFQGAMQARLLTLARECGQRWDDVNSKLETITGLLKRFVSEWEGFEAEREELALWLADLDIRLTAVNHLTGNTCEKLRQLQSFEQCVCVNSGRVNVLLQRGEALMQRSEPADAQHVESHLLELLRHYSLVYNNIARTHTRLLSMRLVFEDDWILSQATDSGCPSETLLEEEGALDNPNLDSPAFPNPPKYRPINNTFSSCNHLPPPPPPHAPSSPTHEHLGLEWDPSVDIGRSVSHDDADSSYFSVSAGLCHRGGVKRRSYLSSLGSHSDISNEEADLRLEGWPDHNPPSAFSPVATQMSGTWLNGDQWVTSTPDRQGGEPVSFDGGRVRAWLGDQNPAPQERTTKAVQTDGQVECYHIDASNQQPPHPNNTQQHSAAPSPSPAHGLKVSSDWVKRQHRSNLQTVEELSCCKEAEHLLPEQRSRPPYSLLSPALLCLLLAAALALLACLIWFVLEPPCHCNNRMPCSFHLALRYVNGPPPT